MKQEKKIYGIVYIVINKVTSKVYIGQKKINKSLKEFDNYWGSGKLIKFSIKKYGKKWFKKEILGYCYSKEKLDKAEIECIRFYNSQNRNNGYNILPGGEGGIDHFTYHLNKDEIRKKMSNARIGKVPWNKGLKNCYSEETIKKFSVSHLGKEFSEEHKKNIKLNHINCSGKNNPMYGKCLYDIWVEKYGQEIANIKIKEKYKKVSMANKGNKNGMYNKSLYEMSVKKNGKEIADKFRNERKNRAHILHKNKKLSDETKNKLKKYKNEKHWRFDNSIDINKIKQLFKEGYSIKEISIKLNTTYCKVKKRLTI